VWECLTKIAISYPKKFKIKLKTVCCVFIGYTYNSSNTYGFLVHKSSIEDIYLNTIMKSRNATFFEDLFPWKEVQENHLFKRIIEDSLSNHHSLEDDKLKFKKSRRAKITKTFGLDFLTYLLKNELWTYSKAMFVWKLRIGRR